MKTESNIERAYRVIMEEVVKRGVPPGDAGLNEVMMIAFLDVLNWVLERDDNRFEVYLRELEGEGTNEHS
jgi:hypothetical protein